MKTLFVITRNDLGRSAKTAQSIHAVGAFMRAHGVSVWPNERIVVLVARDEADLIRWSVKLARTSSHFAEWHEPDKNNELTSIAALGEAVECAVADLPLLR